MFKTGIIGLLIFASVAHAERRVAVIDSGYSGKAKICTFGSYDFIENKYGIGKDLIGHGTTIANTIVDGNSKYCLVILRVFSNGQMQGPNLIPSAIFRAISEHVNVINLSLEGYIYDAAEFVAIKYAISKGIKVFVASGNDNRNLDLMCNIYPACYHIPGLVVVGTYEKGKVGNVGSVVTQQEAWCSDSACGTSLSTAIATRKFLKGLK